MEVRATRVDAEAAIVSRVVDPDPRTKDALKKVLDAGEPVTATNLAEEIAAAPAAEVAAQRTDFELRVRIISIDIEIIVGEKEAPKPPPSDPIVVDLDGDGALTTTGVAAGAEFDVDADGRAERTSWVGGGDAFLVWDRNGNGRVDDGRELFGDQHGAADGIAELQRHDGNQDGRIDANDSVWRQLGLWNGSRIVGLAEAGFSYATTARQALRTTTSGGDAVDGAIALYRSDGSSVLAGDVWLARAGPF